MKEGISGIINVVTGPLLQVSGFFNFFIFGCSGFSLVMVSGGCSLVVGGLLIQVTCCRAWAAGHVGFVTVAPRP